MRRWMSYQEPMPDMGSQIGSRKAANWCRSERLPLGYACSDPRAAWRQSAGCADGCHTRSQCRTWAHRSDRAKLRIGVVQNVFRSDTHVAIRGQPGGKAQDAPMDVIPGANAGHGLTDRIAQSCELVSFRTSSARIRM